MRPLADSGDDTAAFECRDAVSSPCPGTPPTHSWSDRSLTRPTAPAARFAPTGDG
jgi:hypothetical protein